MSGKKITDLHRHYLDDLDIEVNGKTYKRTSEVLDCWFESGAMPYGQQHYPFENEDNFLLKMIFLEILQFLVYVSFH